MNGVCAVLDIGKTHAKVFAVDAEGTVTAGAQQRTPYGSAALDTEALWDWALPALAALRRRTDFQTILPVGHGAGIAVIRNGALAAPIRDYEASFAPALACGYDQVRPPFAQTGSPRLAAGLNLGQQLFALEAEHPDLLHGAMLLTLPLYLSWHLSGIAATDRCSLGCHTDLWNPHNGAYSDLAIQRGWASRFPPLIPEGAPLGPVRAELRGADLAGVTVLAGVHDSNVALAGLERASGTALVSTGTWAVVFAPGSCAPLDAGRDMLVNVDVEGRPVPSARFMSGREWEAIGGGAQGTQEDALDVMRGRTFALPAFAPAGPYAGRQGRVTGAQTDTPGRRGALASLYCGLMIDLLLDLLHVDGRVVIDGPASSDPILTGLLGAVRAEAHLARPATSLVAGGAARIALGSPLTPLLPLEAPERPELWQDYRSLWRHHLESVQ